MSAQLGTWRTRAGHTEVGMLSLLERDERIRTGHMERITRKRDRRR